jgi:N-acetylglucosamine-6-phosphate deacetylase
MTKLAGATLPEAVRMASLTPARVLGLDAVKGSIAVGKDADLVLFDNDINIKQVFIGGKYENNHV